MAYGPIIIACAVALKIKSVKTKADGGELVKQHELVRLIADKAKFTIVEKKDKAGNTLRPTMTADLLKAVVAHLKLEEGKNMTMNFEAIKTHKNFDATKFEELIQKHETANADRKEMYAKKAEKPNDKPKAEQKPKANKPKADKPKADKPKADNPKAETTSDILAELGEMFAKQCDIDINNKDAIAKARDELKKVVT